MEVPAIVTTKDLHAQGAMIVAISRTSLFVPVGNEVVPVGGCEVADTAEDSHIDSP